MSLANKRDEIANALSRVAGVKGHARRPAAPNEGDAWPMLPVLELATGDAFMATWGVRVVVPPDEVAAAEWWDLHWPDLYFALRPVLAISRAVPIVIESNAGNILAFEITGTAEE